MKSERDECPTSLWSNCRSQFTGLCTSLLVLRSVFLVLTLCLAASIGLADDTENLLPNGDFELGDVTPKHWQTIDGLSSFWVQDADPQRGKVLLYPFWPPGEYYVDNVRLTVHRPETK